VLIFLKHGRVNVNFIFYALHQVKLINNISTDAAIFKPKCKSLSLKIMHASEIIALWL
jgi:hypothetical protein